MTIFIWSTIQASRKQISRLLIASLLSVNTACGVIEDKQRTHAQIQNGQLKSAVTAQFPRFQSLPDNLNHYASADFNGDSLRDTALILNNEKEWKLIVFLQTKSGGYSSKEITTFPGDDSRWKSIAAENIHIYPVTTTGQATDRLGLKVEGEAPLLEYYWHEKTQSFGATRIHQTDIAEKIPATKPTQPPTHGEVTLLAKDLAGEEQPASWFDIDRQSSGKKTGADLQFTVGRGSMTFHTLDPVGGATAAPFGKFAPSYQDCLTQQRLMSDGSLPELETQMQFCVKTDMNNLARVWIKTFNPNHNQLTLGYVLWPSQH